jgi:isoleucyl-tRNA synthetase
LLAPFTPFIAEVMYQNLARNVDAQAPESVHHTAWPRLDPQAIRGTDLTEIDLRLREQMALARQICSLGLSARNAVGLKVRQPLARTLIHLGGGNTLANELVSIILDELNVKSLEYVQEVSELVTYRILPDNKKLGPRFGAQFPKLRGALSTANPHAVAAAVQNGLSVAVELDGQTVELAPDEILVHPQPTAGLAVAADKFITVAVDTQVTPELRLEGLAREVVRRVQAMRKEAGFDIADRIITYYQTEGELVQALQIWREPIMAETLSLALLPSIPPEDIFTQAHVINGIPLSLALKRAQSQL